MKTKLVIAFLMSAALVACGGKAKKSTTPENKGDTQTQMNASGSATGGATYGGTMKSGSAAPMPSGGADPCAGN